MTPVLDSTDRRPIHFMGIAGAGMQALAELFARRGVPVTGCDAAPTGAVIDDLRRIGIPLMTGHDPAHAEQARGVVVTSAVEQNHPELERARALGIPVIRRAEALSEAVSDGTLIAVAGTHGKTTTTAMATEALAAAGRDPTGLVGGRVDAWQGNLRFGRTRLYVVEADEYDRSFLALTPSVAVVTNVEADHLDIYGDLAGIHRAFEAFIGPARTVIWCADQAGANALSLPAGATPMPYGIESPLARLQAAEVISVDGRLRFLVRLDGGDLGEMALQVPGVHNVRNALAALAAGMAVGAPFEQLRDGLERFEGVERRFQRLGAVRGIDVVDDYAHHPTEIRATLDAARAACAGRRLVVAFQPHLYSRTRDFADQFGAALAQADAVFLTDIYAAREEPIAGVTSHLIADALDANGRTPTWRGRRSELARALAGYARSGDVIITLGAGDITRTGPELLGLLAEDR